MVKIGCCGFPVSRRKYFENFDVVEVQKTFYMPPEDKTLEKWRKEAPEDFEFVIKAWQLITHPETSPTYRKISGDFENCGYFRDSKCVEEGMKRTIHCAEVLRARAVVFQTPPSFKENEENVKNIIEFFKKYKNERLLFGWEHRGKWSEKTLKYIYEKTGIFEVVDPFKNLPLDDNFIYFRLHGIGGYRYRYSNEELESLRRLVGKEGYIMFNNTNMFEDARRFKEMVSS